MNRLIFLCLTAILTFRHSVHCFLPDRVIYPHLSENDYTSKELTFEILVNVAATYFEDANPDRYNPGDLTQLDSLTPSSLFKEHFGDCVSPANFQNAINEIVDSNLGVDPNRTESKWHFNAEQITEGNKEMLRVRNAILGHIINSAELDYSNLRDNIGKFFHLQQEFYSNTNWVEVNERSDPVPPYLELGYQETLTRMEISSSVPSCKDCIIESDESDCADNYNKDSKLLFSGYRSGQDKWKPRPDSAWKSSWGKCSHGGIYDDSRTQVAKGGINKETSNRTLSPHSHLHDIAARLAIEAGVSFFFNEENGLYHKIAEEQFRRLLNLDPGSSLILVIDDTGSMHDDIDGAKAAAIRLVEKHNGTCFAASQYIVSPFNDPDTGPLTVTSDPAVAIEALNVLYAHGGGDCPELAMTGIEKALLQVNYPASVNVWTDADDKDINKTDAVYALAAQKKASIFFLLTGDCSDGARRKKRAVSDSYTLLADATGGAIYQADKDDIADISNIILTTARPSQVSVLRWRSNDFTSVSLNIPVDSEMEDLAVTVSGPTPGIVSSLCDPSGAPISFSSEQIEVIVDTENVFVFILNTKTPGNWVLKLNGVSVGELFTIEVSALSFLDYIYQIRQKDDSGMISPVEGLPIAGSNAKFLVDIFSPEIISSIDKLQLFDADGRQMLTEYTLKNIKGRIPGKYVADVTLPQQAFTVSIVGTDFDGNLVKRARPQEVQVLSFELKSGNLPGDLVPGEKGNINITFTNVGAKDTFDIDVSTTTRGDTPVVATVDPTEVELEEMDSEDGVVTLTTDAVAEVGESVVVTVTMTSQTTRQRNFLTKRLTVVEQFTIDESIPEDSAPPTCSIVETSDECTLDMINNNCNLHTWSTRIALQDDLVIAEFIVSDFEETSESQYTIEQPDGANIFVNYEANCCCPYVDVTVVDIVGNIETCGVNYFEPVSDEVLLLSQCGLTDERQPCVDNLRVVAESSTQLSLSWSSPTTACMADEFQVKYRLVNEEQCRIPTEEDFISHPWTSSAVNSGLLTDLQPFSTYIIAVTPRRNIVGEGPIALITHETHSDAPTEAPDRIKLSDVSDSSLSISWDTIPCGGRGGNIDHFLYQFVPISDDQAVLSGSTTRQSYTTSDVSCNTAYKFRVAGVNDIGVGPYSEYLEVSTKYNEVAFQQSSELKVRDVTSTTANITWKLTECPPSDFIVEYTLIYEHQCQQNVNQPRTFSGKSPGGSFSITGLKPFSSYIVYVRANTASGSSTELHANFDTAEDIPSSSPVNIQPVPTPVTLTYTWEFVPCSSRRGLVISYRYEFHHPDGTTEYGDTAAISITFYNLLQNRPYGFRLAARTSAGIGAFSTLLSTRTTPAVVFDCAQLETRSCPLGYYQTVDGSCEVARIIRLVLIVTDIDGVPQVYSPEIADDDQFNCRITSQVQEILAALPGFYEAQILNYSEGSIKIDMALVFNKDSSVSGSDVNNLLRTIAGNDGNLGNDLIVNLTDSAYDLCPLDYCLNGGTCVSTSLLNSGECRCTNSFEGERCEIVIMTRDEQSELTEGTIAAIIIAVGVSLLAAVVGTFCCFVIQRKRVQQTVGSLNTQASCVIYPGITLNEPMSDGLSTVSPYFVDPITNNSPWTMRASYALPQHSGSPFFNDWQHAIRPWSFGFEHTLELPHLWGLGMTYPWQPYV